MEKLGVLSRVIHMTSTGFLSGVIILNYFFKTNEFLSEDANFWDLAIPLASIATVVSGAVLFFGLKPKQQNATDDEKKPDNKKKQKESDEEEEENEADEEGEGNKSSKSKANVENRQSWY